MVGRGTAKQALTARAQDCDRFSQLAFSADIKSADSRTLRYRKALYPSLSLSLSIRSSPKSPCPACTALVSFPPWNKTTKALKPIAILCRLHPLSQGVPGGMHITTHPPLGHEPMNRFRPNQEGGGVGGWGGGTRENNVAVVWRKRSRREDLSMYRDASLDRRLWRLLSPVSVKSASKFILSMGLACFYHPCDTVHMVVPSDVRVTSKHLPLYPSGPECKGTLTWEKNLKSTRCSFFFSAEEW